jgi:hypothetical protein
MDELTHYLDTQIMTKENMTTKMSLYFRRTSSFNQAQPHTNHHTQFKVKIFYAPGLIHTTSRKSTENGGKGNER